MAPPEKGTANNAVIGLLAKTLGLSTNAIHIESGHASPTKVITITGLDDEAIKKAFK
jgi:uncharacterized protein YggU (UPF0235/DUF167 family)